MLWKYGH